MSAAPDRSLCPRLAPWSAVSEGKARAARIVRRCALICFFVYSSLPAAAEWTVSGIVGAGNHVGMASVEAQAPSGFEGALSERWSWSLQWAGDVTYWWAQNHSASNSSLWEMGLTPVISLHQAAGSALSSYLEGGVGVHLLSHTHIDERAFSTAFQFGEFLGTGINFGDREQYSIGIRGQHLSNGNIKLPNNGVTFGEIRLAYRWD